jgi:hypothetical protein
MADPFVDVAVAAEVPLGLPQILDLHSLKMSLISSDRGNQKNRLFVLWFLLFALLHV